MADTRASAGARHAVRATTCALLACGLTATGLVVAGPTGAAASAPPTIREVTVSPAGVVLPKSTKKRRTVTVTAQVSDPDGVHRVLVGLYGPKERDNEAVRLTRVKGGNRKGTWKGTLRVGASRRVGTYTIRVFATDYTARSTDPGKVHAWLPVRDLTRVSGFNVAEPARDGAPVRISGTLQRWKPGKKWLPYGGRDLVVEFRADGARSYRAVGRASTDSAGRIRVGTVRATDPGRWRVRFDGSRTRAPMTSGSDQVAVSG